MKILYHHRIASKDGQFVHIDSIVGALERRGHSVVLVGPSAAAQTKHGQTSSIVAFLKRRLPKAIYEILELAYGSLDYFRVASASRQFAPDALYERYNLHTVAGALLKWRHGVPFVLEVNAPLVAERRQHGGLAWPGLARWSEGLIWRSADAILAVTHVLANEITAYGVAAERIWVVPNAIDVGAYRDVPDIALAKRRIGLAGKRVLGFVGFVREWHGLGGVIAWLGERGGPDDVLLLVGDGPALSSLKEDARRRGILDRLVVTGTVPHGFIPGYVAAFDVALQPTVVPYASPLKMFEYMAMARPIIAPDTPNIREILTHGRDAWLVSPEEMSDAISRLLSDASLRKRLGSEAKLTIQRRNLTWDHNATRIEEIMRRIVTNQRTDLR